MGDEYLKYFHDFIHTKLPTHETTFTAKDMVSWVTIRSNRPPRTIVEHLLKRTTNYPCRDNNCPPSYPEDDLFVLVDVSSIEPFRLSLSGRPQFVSLLQDSNSIFFRRHCHGVDIQAANRSNSSSNAVEAKASRIADRTKRNIGEKKVDYEERLEHYLEANLEKLEFGLKLFNDKLGIRRQIPQAGVVDLLCTDFEGNFVAIELKRGNAAYPDLMQLRRYMEGITREFAISPPKVRGILIARSVGSLLLSISNYPSVELFEYETSISEDETSVVFRKII